MGKKAGPAKAKRHIGVGPSQEPTKNLGKRPAIEPNEAEERKKKQREDEERTEKEKWVAKMQKRVFTCERQLNPKGLGTHPVIAAIRYHGLSFFFDKLGCYRRKMVTNFYENMVVRRREHVVVSQVGKVIVEVTPDSIANYLHYVRPADGTSTYPRNPLEMLPNEQVLTLTDAPDSFDPESGRYVAGSLRAKYRTFNKLVHHNLSPFSLDKTPTSYDGKVMIVFGSEKEKVDWAWWIWDEIKAFREKGTSKANIPFPIMITKLCEDAGCKPASGDLPQPGSPGPITAASIRKSEAASKPPRLETIGTSLPTASTFQERSEQWNKIIHARQGMIIEKLESVETEQRRARRRDGKIMRILKWIEKCEGKRSGEYYVETEEDKERDTDEDSEGLHDFGGEDTGDGERRVVVASSISMHM